MFTITAQCMTATLQTAVPVTGSRRKSTGFKACENRSSQRAPVGMVWVSRRKGGVPGQVSSLSLDNCSKLLGSAPITLVLLNRATFFNTQSLNGTRTQTHDLTTPPRIRYHDHLQSVATLTCHHGSLVVKDS
ncbi:hypothetical protein TNCV_4277841 [Trichonephila clavipes]|nr:hypothetical protein TNCV_4277841 [Trichonephila clavipes]